jgi:RNA polymerase sigma-70 factor (ECF subfamily)
MAPDPLTLIADLREMSARHARGLGREEAADLAAEALLRGLRHPPPDGRFRPWLERILRNLVADHWRRLARAERHQDVGAEGGETPEEVALGRERRQLVRQALGQLPREMRRALVLRYYLEADGPAAAAREGISMATVRTRIHRGLARMRTSVGRLRAFPLFGAWRLIPAVIQPAAVAVLLFAQQAPPLAPAPTPPVARRPAVVHPAPAAAPAPPVAPRRSPPHPAPAKVQRFDFDDDAVTAELQHPDETVVEGHRSSPRQPSLIEIPASWLPAIVKSVEDL